MKRKNGEERSSIVWVTLVTAKVYSSNLAPLMPLLSDDSSWQWWRDLGTAPMASLVLVVKGGSQHPISELSVFPMACSIPLQENRKDFIMINKRFKGCWRLIGRGMMQLMAFLLWLSKFLRILDRCLSAGRKVIDQYRSFFNDWFS
jgi:hypothetical protein